MKRNITVWVLLFIVPMCSCHLKTRDKSVATDKISSIKKLNENEDLLFDSLKFDKNIGTTIKEITADTIRRLASYYFDSADDRTETIYDKGIKLEVTADAAEQLVDKLGDVFYKKGYVIFTAEMNFGHSNDVVAVFKTSDQFDVLKYRGTDAANYGHDNAWVIKKARDINKRFPFRITGADLDWFEAKFITPPSDWFAFAKELYHVCPDIVDQGSGSIEALAKEMAQTKTLYLWWD